MFVCCLRRSSTISELTPPAVGEFQQRSAIQ
jgi:hypothetical protein